MKEEIKRTDQRNQTTQGNQANRTSRADQASRTDRTNQANQANQTNPAKRLKVAVLFGGRSSEHTVSLQSAAAVLRAMQGGRFEAVPVGITQEGRWLRFDGSAEDIASGAWESGSCTPVTLSPDPAVHGLLVHAQDGVQLQRIDAAFPVLHGKNGEDGTVQGLLELAGIPCAGCGVLASAVCMDKDIAHRLAQAAGVDVPPCVVLYAGEIPAPSAMGTGVFLSVAECPAALSDTEAVRKYLEARTKHLRYPLFVKPARAGSSFGVTRVETPEKLSEAVDAALLHDEKVLIEQGVPGFEVGCAILGAGGTGAGLMAGEVDEIELAHGFFDYTEKYTLETARIHMPARLPLAERDRIREAAKTVYRALDCAGFARVDLFYTPEGNIVFNEVNTIPGFTEHSRFPGMMRGAGLEFGALVEKLIEGTVTAACANR